MQITKTKIFTPDGKLWYEGEVDENGKPHGYGKLYFASRGKLHYEGIFCNGYPVNPT